MASKQKTQLASQPVKIYFDISRFDDWSEVKHVQLNLFDLETGTNLISGASMLEHKKDPNGALLYIDANGVISTNTSGTPYYVSAASLRILFFDDIKEDAEGHYIVMPNEIISQHLGKTLKTQVRLGAEPIPSIIDAATIDELLKNGLISEWSSPSVFRVINEPSLTWTNQEASTSNATPTFFFSFSTEEKSYKVSASLNGESLEEKLTAYSSVLRFEFKQPLQNGANTIEATLETEGGFVKNISASLIFDESGRIPTYKFVDYKTEHGGLTLDFTDEERMNQFPFVAPQPPTGMRYDKISGKYYFSGTSNELVLLDPRLSSVSLNSQYVIVYKDDLNQGGQIFVHYDYTDGTSDRLNIQAINSGELTTILSVPLPDSLKGIRYSYIGISFNAPDNVKIDPKSIRISSSRSGAVSQYIIKRASAEDSYKTWETLVEFTPQTNTTGRWSYFDNSAHPGVVYKYAIAGRDANGAQSPLGSTMFAVSSADFIWVSTEKYKSIHFGYDANISGLRIARREMLVETLGSQYPYLSISGNMNYKTMNLSATLFHEMDSRGEVLIGHYDREESPGLSTEAIEKDLISDFIPGREKHFILEREFRQALLKELQSEKPILFKNDTDKPIIAAVSMISVSPRRDLGNVIYSFTGTITEIAECSIYNMKKFNLLNQQVIEKE